MLLPVLSPATKGRLLEWLQRILIPYLVDCIVYDIFAADCLTPWFCGVPTDFTAHMH